MTLRQEAHSMIDTLPTEESLRYMVEVMRECTRFLGIEASSLRTADADEKLRALEHMEELREKYPIPADYDYEGARRQAVEAKYGRFT